MHAWLGLGGNLQQPVEQLKEALDRLAASEDIEILKSSSFYRTPPWGDPRQDDFVNAVVQVDTRLAPIPLLLQLQSIERAMGRQRGHRRWGPRLIDIDLLLYGNLTYQSDELVIPHPRMHERAFVLVPMAELDNGLEIPGHGPVESLLQNIDRRGIIRLPEAVSHS